MPERGGHSHSKIVASFGIPQNTVACPYWEYLMEGIICPGLIIPTQIICENIQTLLTLITSIFNAGYTRCISWRSVQHSLAFMVHGKRRPTSSLVNTRHSALSGLVTLLIGSWRNSNMWCYLMSYGSSCFGLVIVYSMTTQSYQQ